MKGFPHIVHTLQKMMTVRNSLMRKRINEYVIAWEYVPVLSFIKEHPMCTQREIAREFSKTPAAITLSTQKLEKLGLIEKNVDKENLRVKRLCITEEGKKVARDTVKVFDDIDFMMRSGIDEKELEIFLKVLDQLYSNLLTGSGMEEPNVKPWD